MKKTFALLSLSGVCIFLTQVYAGDGVTAQQSTSTMRINYQYSANNNAAPAKPVIQSNTDIRPVFLFAMNDQPDALRSMTVRSAVTGAGLMGAIMGGRVAAKFMLNPHLMLSGGVNVFSKTANIDLKF